MPWLDNEAQALKEKVSGLTLSDAASNNRTVEAWFRNPENELRDMTFPSVVLEYGAVSKADDREHRSGLTYLPYIPEQFGPGPVNSVDSEGNDVVFDTTQDFDPHNSPFRTHDYPIPYNIDFTITLYSRFQSELMPLIGKLAEIDRLPSRFGYLEVPQDGTIRTMDLLGGPEIVSERDGDGRRLFMAVYSVRVVSELSVYDVYEITKRINSVNLDLKTITADS